MFSDTQIKHNLESVTIPVAVKYPSIYPVTSSAVESGVGKLASRRIPNHVVRQTYVRSVLILIYLYTVIYYCSMMYGCGRRRQ